MASNSACPMAFLRLALAMTEGNDLFRKHPFRQKKPGTIVEREPNAHAGKLFANHDS